jgi:hypothetical protein
MTEATQPQTQPTPEPEKEVILTLSVTEVNTILGALDEIPHKISRKVIDKIIQQAQAQLQPAA